MNKRIPKLVFFNILIVAFLFVFFEFIIRIFVDEIKLSGTDSTLYSDSVYYDSPGLKKSSSGISFQAFKEVNSDGFWSYSQEKNNHSSRKKLLILGDSATMGIGVENDSTFVGILNTINDSLQFLNTSVIGYSSRDYLNIIQKVVQDDNNSLNISEVDLFWCLNDIYSNYPDADMPGFNTENLLSEVVKFFRTNSKVYHYLKNKVSDRAQAYFKYDELFYTPNDTNFTDAMVNLNKIKLILDRKNISLNVFILPYEFQIRNYMSDTVMIPQRVIKKFLTNYGINVYDCSVSFKDYCSRSKELFLFGDGIHYSKKGHKIIAGYLTNFINKN